MTHKSVFRPESWIIPALIVILMLSAGLRLWNLGFGLPNVYHPDEDAVVMPAMSIIKTGDLHPTRMEYGTGLIYLLAGVSTVVFSLSARDGFIESVEQLTIFERGTYPAIFPHPEYILAGRMVSAVFGVGIVLLVFMLGRRLSGERVGIVSALFAALLPDLVIHSHFATTDMPLTFMVILSLYLLLRVYDNWELDNGWAYAGAGFVCGLATAIKYNGVLLFFPLVLTSLLRVRSLDGLLRLRNLSGVIGMGLGFLVGTPYALLDIPDFLSWFGYSLRLYNRPNVEILQPAWLWHLQTLGMGRNAVLFWAGVIGFGLSWRLWGKRGWLINGFALLFVLAVVSQTNRQGRMWLPVAPFFAIWGGLLAIWLGGWLKERFSRFSARWLAWLPAIILAILSGVVSFNRVYNFGQEDVRTVAEKWMIANMPAGASIAFDYFAPNLDPALWQTERLLRHDAHDVGWYQEQGFEYLMFTEFMYNLAELSNEQADSYQKLRAQLCPVQTFQGVFLSNVGMEMALYHVPPCPSR